MTQVTVIIPCHNAAAWITSAVESALGQTHPPAEVIVVDDASTDDSARHIATFGDRIRFIQGSWRNGNAARNAGLAAATGDWVQFLDADDYLEPEKIARQLAEAGDLATADVLYSPTWIETWRGGHVVHREASPLDADTDLFTQWFTWQLPQTGGSLWRREVLLRIGGWKDDQPCCQEHELYLRALQAGLQFRHCPTPGAVYRIWSEQTVCRKDPVLVIREKTKLIDAAVAWLESIDQRTETHRRAAGLFVLHGPAAPASYRATLNLVGFANAERLARLAR